jgi:hypothetical protein
MQSIGLLQGIIQLLCLFRLFAMPFDTGVS